jgi:hypothetical protein
MKIADVFNEKSKEYYRQENASEYAYITADEYTSEEVIEMEKRILTLLDFNCFSPTIPHYLKLLELPEKVRILSNYLSDLMLLTTKTLKFKPSLVANAILMLCCGAVENYQLEETQLELCKLLFPNCTLDEFADCVKTVQRFWHEIQTSPSSKTDAVNMKYDSQEVIRVKEIPIPSYELSKIDNWFCKIKELDPSVADSDLMQTE